MASLALILSLPPFALHFVDECDVTKYVRRVVVDAQFELRPYFSHVARPIKIRVGLRLHLRPFLFLYFATEYYYQSVGSYQPFDLQAQTSTWRDLPHSLDKRWKKDV
jgi:hypothetical protein